MSTKLKLSSDASTKLQFLSNRLDIRRNLIARMAIGQSLKQPSPIDIELSDNNGQEFNRITLTGKYDSLFKLLISENEGRLITDDEFFPTKFKDYLEHGIDVLYAQYLKINSPGEFLIYILTDETVQTKFPEDQ